MRTSSRPGQRVLIMAGRSFHGTTAGRAFTSVGILRNHDQHRVADGRRCEGLQIGRDGRARTRLASVILVGRVSDVVEPPGGGDPEVLDGVDQPDDVMIGVLQEAGVHLQTPSATTPRTPLIVAPRLSRLPQQDTSVRPLFATTITACSSAPATVCVPTCAPHEPDCEGSS